MERIDATHLAERAARAWPDRLLVAGRRMAACGRHLTLVERRPPRALVRHVLGQVLRYIHLGFSGAARAGAGAAVHPFGI